MTTYQISLQGYQPFNIDALSPLQALSKGIHSLYSDLKRRGRPQIIYFRGDAFPYSKRKILIDLVKNFIDVIVSEMVLVPSLINMSLDQAEQVAKEFGLDIGKVDQLSLFEGVVVKQHPEAYNFVPKHSVIDVTTNIAKNKRISRVIFRFLNSSL